MNNQTPGGAGQYFAGMAPNFGQGSPYGPPQQQPGPLRQTSPPDGGPQTGNTNPGGDPNSSVSLGQGMNPWLERWTGGFTAPMSPYENQALAGTSNFVGGGMGLGGAQSYLNDTMSGKYLDVANNPNFKQIQSSEDTLNQMQQQRGLQQIQSRMAAGGNALSGAEMGAEGDFLRGGNASLQALMGNLMANQYSQERGLQSNAATQQGNLANTQLGGYGQLMSQGAVPRQNDTAELLGQYSDFTRQQDNLKNAYQYPDQQTFNMLHSGYPSGYQMQYQGSNGDALTSILTSLLGGSGGGGGTIQDILNMFNSSGSNTAAPNDTTQQTAGADGQRIGYDGPAAPNTNSIQHQMFMQSHPGWGMDLGGMNSYLQPYGMSAQMGAGGLPTYSGAGGSYAWTGGSHEGAGPGGQSDFLQRSMGQPVNRAQYGNVQNMDQTMGQFGQQAYHNQVANWLQQRDSANPADRAKMLQQQGQSSGAFGSVLPPQQPMQQMAPRQQPIQAQGGGQNTAIIGRDASQPSSYQDWQWYNNALTGEQNKQKAQQANAGQATSAQNTMGIIGLLLKLMGGGAKAAGAKPAGGGSGGGQPASKPPGTTNPNGTPMTQDQYSVAHPWNPGNSAPYDPSNPYAQSDPNQQGPVPYSGYQPGDLTPGAAGQQGTGNVPGYDPTTGGWGNGGYNGPFAPQDPTQSGGDPNANLDLSALFGNSGGMGFDPNAGGGMGFDPNAGGDMSSFDNGGG